MGRSTGVAPGNHETCVNLNRDLGKSSNVCLRRVVFAVAAGTKRWRH